MAKIAAKIAALSIAVPPSVAGATDPINEAILVYTGFGSSSFPRARGNDLVARYGAEMGADLKQRIVGLLEELQQPYALSEKRSRKSVTEQVMEQFRPRHPELGDEACRALSWTFSFGMR